MKSQPGYGESDETSARTTIEAPSFTETCISLLIRRSQLTPNAPLVSFTDGKPYSRGDVLVGALAMAAELRESGVVAGDRVAIFSGNRIEYVYCMFACAHIGAAIVPINIALRGDLLAHILDLTSPKVLIVERPLVTHLAALEAFTRLSPIVVELGSTTWGPPIAQAAAPTLPSTTMGTDVAAIMFTSGTTGRSKGVGWTHQMALYDAYASAVVMDYRETDVIYTCLPLFHITALCTSLLGALLAGGSVVISPRFSASRFWQDIVANDVTVTNMMGSMAAILWRQPHNDLERQHRLRIALVIPAPMGYYDEFEQRFGLHMTMVYGSTDMGLPIGVPFGERRPGSCGKVLDGWECRIADANDFPVAAGETGELLIRPVRPFIGQLGYWQMPDATVAAWRNLWFHTGDLLRSDTDGWLYYVGRNKDAIRKSGENVSAFEVELAVAAYAGIQEVAVFGVPSELGEEEVAAVIVVQDGVIVDLDGLRSFLEQRLPMFAVPRYVAVRSSLPKTETQKIKKESLRSEAITPDMRDLGSTSASRGRWS